MTTVHDLARYAGGSVDVLKIIADRIPKEVDYFKTLHPTRHGGVREIVMPTGPLDTVTKNLHRSFTGRLPYVPPDHVHGFVKGRSAITNAAQHLAQDCVLRVDLQDFFPSITSERVKSAFLRQGFDEEAANLCVQLTTIGGSLPIGLSTSPIISNLVFESTDAALANFSAENDLKFTRYVDDLAFSGTLDDRHLAEVRELLGIDGWTVNERKTAFMRRGGPQYVTGLYVGCADRPRIPKAIKRQMRWVAHTISMVGYDTYMSDFGGEDANMFPQRLLGWARHIASVEPDRGYELLRLLTDNIPEGYVRREERLGWLRLRD